MGLDMFLRRKIYVGANYESNNVSGNISLKKDGKDLDIPLNKVIDITLDCAYWRKANQIHNWFVNNVQDGVDNCADYYVSSDELKELINLCKKVLEDNSLAEELLPSSSGFLFGNTGYDEYYFNNLKETIEMIEPYLESENDFYYSSSW